MSSWHGQDPWHLQHDFDMPVWAFWVQVLLIIAVVTLIGFVSLSQGGR